MQTANNRSRYFFDAPKGSKWAIEFSLRKDQAQKVKANDDITLRGRFSRRPNQDAHVMLSNVSLVESK